MDVGGLGDQSFNDAANRGLQQAIADGLVCEENVKLVPANAAGSNLDSNIQALASAGYQYVEGVGFSFSPGVCKVAGDFPDTDFAVVDGYTQFIKGCDQFPNVLDLSFAANEGSYLVGIAAAMQAQKDGSDTVGFLGGQTGPLIGSFEGGYEAGVASVDKNIKVLVEYIGDSTQAFVNPTAGKALSEKMYSEGADVIYHAAGLSGAGLFQAAAEKSKYAIGVDSDQYLTASAAEQKWIITSALKRVDTATYDTIKAVGDGSFKGGTQTFNLANDGVGFATSNPTLPDLRTWSTRWRPHSRRSSTGPSPFPRSHSSSGRDRSMERERSGARERPARRVGGRDQAVPRRRRERRCVLGAPCRGDPRARRRERSGQVDADARALRDLSGRRREDPGARQRVEALVATGRDRQRHRDGAPALRPGGSLHRHREHHPGRRGRPAARSRGGERAGRGARRILRVLRRPERQGRGSLGR